MRKFGKIFGRISFVLHQNIAFSLVYRNQLRRLLPQLKHSEFQTVLNDF